MAGPRVWWPNRKSKHGLQASSKTPYRHDQRVFSTTPPIAEDPMLTLKQYGLGDLESAVLSLKAMNAALEEENGDLRRKVRDQEALQKLLDDSHVWREKAEALMADTNRAIEEADQKLVEARAEAKAARKAVDPDAIALKVMYGVEEATKEHTKQMAEMRSVLAQKDSEIEELKRSKKRLREALQRLSRDT